MNERTDALLRSYKPEMAVVVYASGQGQSVYNNKDYYLESHAIDEKGQLLEGKPLKQDTISEIVDVFFDERQNRVQVSGLIPSNLLQFDIIPGGNYKLMWHRPAEKRSLYFATGLHINNGVAWVPPMLYVANRKELDVFVLENDNRPTEVSKLFHAPFFNVSDGSVCLGSAKVKDPVTRTYENLMRYWEDMFWLSEFSHLAANSNPTKGNLATIWKSLIGTETKWSDLKPVPLIKMRNILKDIL